MRVITGGATGIVKIINPQKEETLKTIMTPDRKKEYEKITKEGDESTKQHKNRNGVTTLTFIYDTVQQKNNESQFGVGYEKGNVIFYLTATGHPIFELEREFDHAPIGLFAHDTQENRTIMVGGADGTIETYTYQKGIGKKKEIKSSLMEIEGPLEVYRKNKTHNLLAAGGKDNPVKIYDIEKQNEIYKTEYADADGYGIQEKIWIKDIAFLEEDNILATTCKYHKIRYYDRRAGPKPIIVQSYSDFALTAIEATSSISCTLGTATGKLMQSSFKKQNGAVALYRPHPQGAIRAIGKHPTESLVCATGVDRYVRVYNTTTRALKFDMYVTAIQNALLVTSDIPEVEEDSDFSSESESDDDTPHLPNRLHDYVKKKGPPKKKKRLNL